jgi:hypothetical protein
LFGSYRQPKSRPSSCEQARQSPHDQESPSKAIQRWDTEGGAAENGPQQEPRKKRPRDANQLAKSIVGIATGEDEDREPTPEEQGKDPAAVALGRKGGLKGGKARAKALSKARRAQIAREAALTRWDSKKK